MLVLVLVHGLSFPGGRAGQAARSGPRARWRRVGASAHLHSPGLQAAGRPGTGLPSPSSSTTRSARLSADLRLRSQPTPRGRHGAASRGRRARRDRSHDVAEPAVTSTCNRPEAAILAGPSLSTDPQGALVSPPAPPFSTTTSTASPQVSVGPIPPLGVEGPKGRRAVPCQCRDPADLWLRQGAPGLREGDSRHDPFKSSVNVSSGASRRRSWRSRHPSLQIWDGVLALPLIGTFDVVRSAIVTESLLQRVVDMAASVVDLVNKSNG